MKPPSNNVYFNYAIIILSSGALKVCIEIRHYLIFYQNPDLGQSNHGKISTQKRTSGHEYFLSAYLQEFRGGTILRFPKNTLILSLI